MTRLQEAIRHELTRSDERFVGYEQELLRQATPGPASERGAHDRRLDGDDLENRRSRRRMWSYKGVGLRL